MDPIVERPRSDEGGAPEPRLEVGLVDLVDEALVRLDGIRDRPRVSSAVTALLVFVLVVGWALARWRTVEPIDGRIPDVGEMVTAGGVGSEAASDEGSTAAGASGGSPGAGGATDPGDGANPATTTEPATSLVVHVSGAVRKQGLVELAEGARLADAIHEAGGATDEADVHRLNLAMPLMDGMHIRVPEVGEEPAPGDGPLVETASPGGGSGAAADGSSAAGDGSPVNVNQADLVELQNLPGVGPAIAGAIVSWREDNGRFTSVDELLEVPGIGPAKLAAIENQVVL